MTIIETKRLTLRRFTAGDWRDFQKLAIDWQAAPGPAFDKWPTSEAACRASVEHMSSNDNYFAVCLRASGAVIGLLGINGIDDQQQLDLGHVILSRYQDNSHDQEALRAAVGYCFGLPGVGSIVTRNASDHPAQLAPLKSLGFINASPDNPGELILRKTEWARRG